MGIMNGDRIIIYFIQLKNSDGFIKIGSSFNLNLRLKQFKKIYPYEIELLYNFECYSDKIGGGLQNIEYKLHQKFKKYKLPKINEWFYPNKEILEYIEYLKKVKIEHQCISPPRG